MMKKMAVLSACASVVVSLFGLPSAHADQTYVICAAEDNFCPPHPGLPITYIFFTCGNWGNFTMGVKNDDEVGQRLGAAYCA
jgi:hypothetical protein